ncbi:hypothetical protein [Aestuariivivens sediminis]|uniref:hypothetical protein n=1 Tax=Aestuariivivens sediminis TaxID=2913557 RepID=UPI001F57F578|nr:hypothetical protein [Aestuariivivens sediminis]
MKWVSWLITLGILPGFYGYGQNTSAEQHVRDIYQGISTRVNEEPDWDKVKTLFCEDAILYLRISTDSTALFSVDDWIQDFKNFIKRRDIKQTGFQEKVINVKSFEFGNIAQCTVIYEARIPGVTEGHQGVDGFHLIKRDGQWKVISLINEVPSEDRPLPISFFKK